MTGAPALTAAAQARRRPLAVVRLLPAAPMQPEAPVRALPGAVVAFAAALAAGAPTRTSAQPTFTDTMRFGPTISKGIGFARLSPGMATMTSFFRLR